jgi:hypothetical protein
MPIKEILKGSEASTFCHCQALTYQAFTIVKHYDLTFGTYLPYVETFNFWELLSTNEKAPNDVAYVIFLSIKICSWYTCVY